MPTWHLLNSFVCSHLSRSLTTNWLQRPSTHWRLNGLNVSHILHSPYSTISQYKVAVIGSGPSGFYTAQQLLKNPNVSVDIYEKFPVPFGLVRFGVAPDHQEVKNVINSFTKVALNERTRFVGNIDIGTDVTLAELRAAYHAVVLCYGSSQDSLLNIPGENLANVVSARRFVGWYNGIPQDKDLDISLDCDTALIVGQGNVALDCARILLLSADKLKKTDITNHAYTKLRNSQIRKVIIVGRRGPMQAAFKIKEFRELTKMPDCKVKIDLCNKNNLFDESILNTLSRPRKRFAELYLKILQESDKGQSSDKECILKFFRSPCEIVANSDDSAKSQVTSVRLKTNILDDYVSENGKILQTLEEPVEEIKCGIVIRSIGYRSSSLDPSLPFDEQKGVIINTEGRVANSPGLYCSGWAAFGATGVILNTMNASFEVGKNILFDIQAGLLDEDGAKQGYENIEPVLLQRNSQVVNFIDWQRIDEYERARGLAEGKLREKVVSLDEIMHIKKDVT